jgi:hypothetical protein
MEALFMKRLLIPSLLVSILGLAMIAPQVMFHADNAVAQAPKGRQSWEYAYLVIGDASVPKVIWMAGKTSLASSENQITPDYGPGINELYRQLGGKEQAASLGEFLNHLGRDGWELVSYTNSTGAQRWWFKRARQ